MADEEVEETTEYKLTLPNGQVLKRSRDFTGNATALYPPPEGEEIRDTYSGDFVDGIREGSGKYLYTASGSSYTGQWKENRKEGLGRASYVKLVEDEEGNISRVTASYHGDFLDGLKSGEGSYLYSNGDRYSGSWVKGLKEGWGVYLSPTGRLEGTWKAGNIEQGNWILENGSFWHGIFQNNKPSGRGTWNLPNGEVVKGEYTQILEEVESEQTEESAAKRVMVKDLIWRADYPFFALSLSMTVLCSVSFP